MVRLYGIPNCNTVKKARQWLQDHGIDCHFHDFKKEGVDPARLDAWLERVGWETLVNRRGTTWRRLPEEARDGLDRDKARGLLMTHPTLIKRPVLEHREGVVVGFDPEAYGRIK